MKRIIYLGTRLFFVAIAAAAIMAFGCHGSNINEEAEIGSGEDSDATSDQITLGSQAPDGSRGIFITFPDAIPETAPETSVAKADEIVTQADYEAAVTVKDANGNLKVISRKRWIDDKTLRLAGPWRWCASYSVYLEGVKVDDVTFDDTYLNLDKDEDCTADIPVYDEDSINGVFEAYVLPGDAVLDLSERPFTLDLKLPDATADFWHYSVESKDRGLVNLGDLDGDGVSSVAMSDIGGASETSGSLLIWNNLSDEDPDHVLEFVTARYSPTEVQPPASVMDINGDGLFDFAVADLLVNSSGEIIDINGDPTDDPGAIVPAYYYMFGGSNFSVDETWQAAFEISAFPDKPSEMCGAFIGNLDGDVSSTGHPIGDVISCFGYSSTQVVSIVYGDEGMTDMAENLYESVITTGYPIKQIYGGDLNGDGVADLAAAAGDGTSSEHLAEARIYFSTKGERGLPAISQPDVTIIDDVTTNLYKELEVFVPGDINADGIGDLFYVSNYTDEMANTYNVIYVFLGREEWVSETATDEDPTAPFYVSEADFTIVSGDSTTGLKMLPIAVGDLDNDGYDDFAVKVGGSSYEYIAIFRGGKTFLSEYELYSNHLKNRDDVYSQIVFSAP